MKKEKIVRTYQRRTKSGKMVTVRQHTASYDAAEKAKGAAKRKAYNELSDLAADNYRKGGANSFFKKNVQSTAAKSTKETSIKKSAETAQQNNRASSQASDIKSMTNEQLFEKYKIPKVTVEEIRTKRGHEYGRDKNISTKNEEFASELRSAVNKYGAPIKVDKRNVNTYNDYEMRRSALRELDYDYYKGTVVDVTFKDDKGRVHVISSSYLGFIPL